MLNRIKARCAVISLMAIMLSLCSQMSVAYYTTADRATNVVTSGNIQFIIHETTDKGQVYPTERVYVLPGQTVSKQVSIENDCQHPFYLRVKMVFSVNADQLSAENCFKLDIDESAWEYHEGWYYYKDIVDPGETTPYVFTKVEIDKTAVNSRYRGKTLSLSVVAQAVQSENNPISEGNTYTASGWPKE